VPPSTYGIPSNDQFSHYIDNKDYSILLLRSVLMFLVASRYPKVLILKLQSKGTPV